MSEDEKKDEPSFVTEQKGGRRKRERWQRPRRQQRLRQSRSLFGLDLAASTTLKWSVASQLLHCDSVPEAFLPGLAVAHLLGNLDSTPPLSLASFPAEFSEPDTSHALKPLQPNFSVVLIWAAVHQLHFCLLLGSWDTEENLFGFPQR